MTTQDLKVLSDYLDHHILGGEMKEVAARLKGEVHPIDAPKKSIINKIIKKNDKKSK